LGKADRRERRVRLELFGHSGRGGEAGARERGGQHLGPHPVHGGVGDHELTPVVLVHNGRIEHRQRAVHIGLHDVLAEDLARGPSGTSTSGPTARMAASISTSAAGRSGAVAAPPTPSPRPPR
jgi:hypothetical protein